VHDAGAVEQDVDIAGVPRGLGDIAFDAEDFAESWMLFSSAYATVMGTLPPLISDKTAVISDECSEFPLWYQLMSFNGSSDLMPRSTLCWKTSVR
jgi:hypothetical protein